MPKITLVCSGHQENGLCNAGELLKILHDIKPEAAFLEMRPSEFDMFYAHGSVEAHAVSRYREFKEVQPVPVDGYHASGNHLAEIKRVFDGVIDYVTDASHEYRQLTEEQFDNVFHLGFPYLNGATFATIAARLAAIEDEVIKASRNQVLESGLRNWRQFIEQRESEMVRNIYSYCRRNEFGTGVLLVGAAHKKAIVEKIESVARTESDLIVWELSYEGGV